jgi:hypothetical protein
VAAAEVAAVAAEVAHYLPYLRVAIDACDGGQTARMTPADA